MSVSPAAAVGDQQAVSPPIRLMWMKMERRDREKWASGGFDGGGLSGISKGDRSCVVWNVVFASSLALKMGAGGGMV